MSVAEGLSVTVDELLNGLHRPSKVATAIVIIPPCARNLRRVIAKLSGPAATPTRAVTPFVVPDR
jgi:hypothetical protein